MKKKLERELKKIWVKCKIETQLQRVRDGEPINNFRNSRRKQFCLLSAWHWEQGREKTALWYAWQSMPHRGGERLIMKTFGIKHRPQYLEVVDMITASDLAQDEPSGTGAAYERARIKDSLARFPTW